MERRPNLCLLTSEQKDELIVHLFSLVEQLEKRIIELEARNKELEERLGKDSRNSHKPPSSDSPFKKTKSLRQSSTRNAGGQEGHKGRTLKQVAHPDEVMVHGLAEHCDECGAKLNEAEAQLSEEVRQVFDLPEMGCRVTEHRVLQIQCDRCGKRHQGSFPLEVSHTVQYSASVKAAGVYLTQRQLLPVKRACETLSALYGLPISVASVETFKAQAADQLAPIVTEIAEAISQCDVAHFDETGLRVNGKLHWMHVASTQALTWYGVHERRGQVAMHDFGILPRFKGTAIHDGLTSYRQYPCTHGLCNAHHLRELDYLVQTLPEEAWPGQMMTLLREAKDEVDKAREVHPNLCALSQARLQYYRNEYDKLLHLGESLHPKITVPLKKSGKIKQSTATNLLGRLREYTDDVLRFTIDFRVPFDNNQAERDIRMPKLKQKISGCFRTIQGAQHFCTVRSYLASLHKQRQNLFHALKQTFMGYPPHPMASARTE